MNIRTKATRALGEFLSIGKNIPDRHEQCVLETSSKIFVPLVRNQTAELHIQHCKIEGPRPSLEFGH